VSSPYAVTTPRFRSLHARLTQPIHTPQPSGDGTALARFPDRTWFLSMTKVTDEHIQTHATNSLVSQGGDNA
jgi:hypothetical protein